MKISILILTFCVSTLIVMCSSKKDYSNWEVTVATVDRLYAIDGTDMAYRYQVDGVAYSGGGSAPSGTIFGDKYLILYDKNNPSESIANITTPFFCKSDRVAFTKGKISNGKISLHKYKDKKYQYFGYEYYVDGRKYKRDQIFYSCGEPIIILKKGMEFDVKYSVELPARAVMMIDSIHMYIFEQVTCDEQSKFGIDGLVNQ